MTRTRGVLYVSDYRAKVGVQSRSLLVRSGPTSTRVPVHACEAVVLFGGQITTEALDLCVRHGIRVAGIRRSGKVRFTLGGPTGGNVLLRVAQVRAADGGASQEIAGMIVAAKLESYRRLLIRWANEAPPMAATMMVGEAEVLAVRRDAARRPLTGDQVRGIEGDGTRRYFKGLAVVLANAGEVGRFNQRNRRPPRDPVNALLSFLYGLALTEIVGALEAIRLDPQIGFLHRLRPGRPSLGLDLLEELRPVTDRLAARMLGRHEVRLEHFARLSSGACLLTDAGRAVVLERYERFKEESITHPTLRQPIERWQLPTVQATLLARHLRGDLPVYLPYVIGR